MIMPNLKNHPFSVEAYFKKSVVLTFAIEITELEDIIPECLELDTYNNKYAFLAVAMVQTIDLRPKGLPKLFGSDFFLIGYRVFVKYTTKSGKRLRGLYILKSETNRKKMEIMGNLFTHYNYTTTDIKNKITDSSVKLSSEKSNFELSYSIKIEDIELPKESPFPTWKAARRYAGPLPFTFTYNKEKKEVLIIEGVRQNWKPRPLKVTKSHFEFIEYLNFKNCTLANAFIIENIPYYWKKGKLESWN